MEMQPNNSSHKNPTVSVIIPTYNRAQTINRAVQSVLDQTFSDFKVIVVDDASTDGTDKLAASFKDSRIRYIRHDSNKGGSAARNTGIRSSTGKYIAFLDSDDTWLPEKLRLQVQHFESLTADVGVVYTGLTALSKNNTIIGNRVPAASGNIQSAIYAENCIGPLSTVMVRRDCLVRVGLFDEDLPACQDWDLYIRIAGVCQFSFISEALVRYYVSDDAITKNALSRAIGYKAILNKYLTYIKVNKYAFARQSLTIGHYLCQSGARREGISYLLKAAFSCPFYLRLYPYLLAAVFPGSWYNRIVAMKQAMNHGSIN
jgi:glycosyltransferase involved in cell wall biosynthesis